MSFLGFSYKLCHASGIGLGRIPTGLLPYSSRDTQGTRTYPGQTPYDCVISADYRTRIGRAPEGDRTISDDDRPMSLRHPITNCPPLSTHCRPIIFRISPEALSSPEKNLTTTTMTDRFSPALRHRRTPPICRYPPAAGLNVTEVLSAISTRLSDTVFSILRHGALNICSKPPTRRSCRGGRFVCRRPRYYRNIDMCNGISVIDGRRPPSLKFSTNMASPVIPQNHRNFAISRKDIREPDRQLNVRSICNKATDILELFSNGNVDILGITETWLKDGDTVTTAELKSYGQNKFNRPRLTRSCGGVGLVYKPEFTISEQPQSVICTSFEHMECKIQCQNTLLQLLLVYRPSISVFVTEFGGLLEQMLTSALEFVIMGDFNIHCDQTENCDTTAFINLLESCDLKQHVEVQTHSRGHMLDLLITRSSSDIIKSIEVFDPAISDHSMVSCSLDVFKSKRPRESLSYRRIKAIDIQQFTKDIIESPLADTFSALVDPKDLVASYNTLLGKLLDKHAPLKTKTKFSLVFRLKSFRKSKAETNKWRSTKLTVHRDIYKIQRNKVEGLIKKAKRQYYNNLILQCNEQGNSNRVFRVLDKLLGRKTSVVLLSHGSATDIAQSFDRFFQSKISNIRAACEKSVKQHLRADTTSDVFPKDSFQSSRTYYHVVHTNW